MNRKDFLPFLQKETYSLSNLTTLHLRKVYGLLVIASFLLAFLGSVYAYTSLYPKAKVAVNLFVAEALNGYPPGLVVTFKDGVMTKNIPGPVSLYPLRNSKGESLPLIHLNDATTASTDQLIASRAALLVAKDGVIAKKSNGYQISPYDKKFSFEITSSLLREGAEYVQLYTPRIFAGTVLLFVLYSLLIKPLLFMFGILVIAGVLFIFREHFFKEPISFKVFYTLILFLAIPVFILKFFLSLTSLPSGFFATCLLTGFSFWYFVVDAPKREAHSL